MSGSGSGAGAEAGVGSGSGIKSPFMWNSRRSAVMSTHGMVASTQPLASDVGLTVLKEGGNAVDAAVAMAAALNVTEPTSTGIGGDAFCLYFDAATGKMHALNGSGRCPAGLSLDAAKAAAEPGAEHLPMRHAHCITVPGAAAAWVDSVDKWGTWSMDKVLAPAIKLAKEGVPISPVTAVAWSAGEHLLRLSPNAGEMLMPDDTPPKAGQVFRNPTLAKTFETLAAEGKAGFYSGRIAEEIVKAQNEAGGVMSLDDLTAHVSTFPDPICVNYRGYDVYECPPNGQGITALIALNILEGVEGIESAEAGSVELLHAQIEALRLAFADARWYVADPDVTHVPIDELLSKDYAAKRRELIDRTKAAVDVEKGSPTSGSNTVSFQVVDAFGNACSYINSNYEGFGSGIIPKGCGFTLQNRGANFSLVPDHPNQLAPGKRPYHTIIPCQILKDGKLFASMSTMGGFLQPSGHVQVAQHLIDRRLDPQVALDMPRFCIARGISPISLEDTLPPETIEALGAMGHTVNVLSGQDRVYSKAFCGRGQVILVDPDTGVLWGGSDGRGDGLAIGY